jgi:hypothetical protein
MTLDIDRIKKLMEAATPGPWCYDDNFDNIIRPTDWADIVDSECNECRQYRRAFARHEDAEFVASARTDVPELVAEVERLRGVVALMDAVVREAVRYVADFNIGDSASLDAAVDRYLAAKAGTVDEARDK